MGSEDEEIVEKMKNAPENVTEHMNDLVSTNMRLTKVYVNWYKDLKNKSEEKNVADDF